MNVDEALQLALNIVETQIMMGGGTCGLTESGHAFVTLHGEVGRLRGDNERLRAENAALKENASATLYHESLRLKRENEELRRQLEAK